MLVCLFFNIGMKDGAIERGVSGQSKGGASSEGSASIWSEEALGNSLGELFNASSAISLHASVWLICYY